MPLILAPYTMGTQLPATPTVIGGGGYVQRRRRFLAYILSTIAFLMVLPL